MNRISVIPFGAEHMAPAAALLAARHGRWRSLVPSLPKRFEDPRAAQGLLEAALGATDAHALAAVDETGMLLSYMVGAPRLDEVWGRSAWVPLEGVSAADDTDPELTRDLYAAWADHWVERGVFGHYALVPAAFDQAVGAWFRMGFGNMHAYAIRGTEVTDLGKEPNGLVIHRARPGDRDAVTALGDLISRALLEAPTFAVTLPERWETMRAEWEHELEEPEGDLWIARHTESASPLGLAGFYPSEPGPATPEGAVELAVAMTAPESRGRGVMRALLRHGLAFAADQGASMCVTDWRVANLTASRAWPALGFQPLYWRLHRMVDQRILWARSAAPPR